MRLNGWEESEIVRKNDRREILHLISSSSLAR